MSTSMNEKRLDSHCKFLLQASLEQRDDQLDSRESDKCYRGDGTPHDA